MEKQFVAFEAVGNRYCIDIMDVQEVCRESTITYMPNFPDFVEGVINLRGKIMPIISIHKKIYTPKYSSRKHNECNCFDKDRVKLSLDPEPVPKMHSGNHQEIRVLSYKLIVVKIGSVLIGLLVDNLDKILNAHDSDVQDGVGMGQMDQSVISGILHVDGEIYVVLNTKGILDSEEERALQAQLDNN